LSDIRATPLEGAVPGIDVHAEIIEHLLSGASLSRPDYAPALEALLIVTGAAIAALAAVKLSPMLGAAVALIMVELMIGGSFWAFLRRDILIDAALPGLATIGAYAVMTVGVLRRSQRDQRAIRASFGRYLSPAIVDKIAANPEQLALGGEIRTITVLFSDIRGFTQRSETLAAQDVLGFLNAIHTPMTEEVLNSGGTLDKFIGDGMMAFWNAPLDVPDHTRRALACALRMEKAMERVEVDLRAESDRRGVSHSPVAIGIGIHVGPACVGNVGSVKRLEYSAIGDNVNTAARIEPTSKAYGVTTIVSQDVADAAPDFALLPIDEVQLRGRSGKTRLFALHGGASEKTHDFNELLRLHEAALAALASGDMRAASLAIAQARAHPLGARYGKVHAIWESRLAREAQSVEV
jgi:adenylate cyclase